MKIAAVYTILHFKLLLILTWSQLGLFLFGQRAIILQDYLRFLWSRTSVY